MSTIKVFKQFYPNLVRALPMDDPVFTAELYARDLLPDDFKEHLDSLPTSAKKASHFLDHVIKPSVTSGVGSRFDKLLNVMKDSDYETVRELGKQIKDDLGKQAAGQGDDDNEIG